MTFTFPVFKASLEATCFKCGEKLAPRTIAFTHNAPGRGQWVGSCDKCDVRTWFDIKVVKTRNELKKEQRAKRWEAVQAAIKAPYAKLKVENPPQGPVDPADYIEYEDRQEVLRSMGRVMDDEPEHKSCPQCGGEPALLGQLGNITHLRCRDCGWDFTL